MSILIKGMEMPKDGTFSIVHIYSDGHVSMPCWGKGMQIVQDIEAVPVPPHGKLIDADALMDLIRAHDYPLTAQFNSRANGMFTIGIQQAVDETPTIIPADGKDGVPC